jgi:L,D-transpeptidase ErfK/SrfK
MLTADTSLKEFFSILPGKRTCSSRQGDCTMQLSEVERFPMLSSLIPAVVLLLQLVGREWTYTVQTDDTLTSIAARYAVDAQVIAETNNLKNPFRLSRGQKLQIDNRHMVPSANGKEIVINVPQRILFYFRDNALLKHYPIAAGRRTWPTPLGVFEILTAETDPAWDVPPSIQAEMRRQGKPTITRVPPGPSNPLGKYWFGLSLPGIGIHGTNAPASIYSLVSHGCIRLHPDDMADFFNHVGVGTRGMVVYEPVLIAASGGRVFVEAHPDAYGKATKPLDSLRNWARTQNFAHLVDWDLVENVIRKREGIARDVTVK